MMKKATHRTRDRRSRPSHKSTPGRYAGKRPAPWYGNNRCPCSSCNGSAAEYRRARGQSAVESRRERRKLQRILEQIGFSR